MKIIRTVAEKIGSRFNLDKTALAAAEVGRLKVIDYLIKTGKITYGGTDLAAARGGHTKLYPHMFRIHPEEILGEAAKRGDISGLGHLQMRVIGVFKGAALGGHLDLAREYMPAAIAEIKRLHGTWTGNEGGMPDLLTKAIARGDRELIYLLDKEIAYDDNAIKIAGLSGDLFIITYLLTKGLLNTSLIYYAWRSMDRDIFNFIIDNSKNIRSIIVDALHNNYTDDFVIAMIERGNWSADLEGRTRRHELAERIAMLNPAH